MGESNDGFGLSLSLGMPPATTGKNSNGFELATHSFPLNLLHPRLPFMQQNSPKIFQSSSEERNGEGRRCERGGIDINQPVMTAECDDNVMASSPHSTASTVTGKRSEMEFEAAAAAEMTTSSMEEEDDGGDAAARKKLRLSKEQAVVLEDTFRGHNTLNPKQKVALAKQLNLKPRQVEVWFQNRRARTKLKQTEIDCEYLRRCCERLADENRRLHKEVNDLRALKLSPQVYMNMSPPTTLIMCPQCQRAPLSSPPPSSSSSTSGAAAGHRQQAVAPGLIQWTAILQPQSRRPQL